MADFMADFSLDAGDPSNFVGILHEMGFELSRAQHAVALSGQGGLEAVLQHLLNPTFTHGFEGEFMDLTDSPIRPRSSASRSDKTTPMRIDSPVRPAFQQALFCHSASGDALVSASESTTEMQIDSSIQPLYEEDGSSSSSHDADSLDSASPTLGIYAMNALASVSESATEMQADSPIRPLHADNTNDDVDHLSAASTFPGIYAMSGLASASESATEMQTDSPIPPLYAEGAIPSSSHDVDSLVGASSAPDISAMSELAKASESTTEMQTDSPIRPLYAEGGSSSSSNHVDSLVVASSTPASSESSMVPSPSPTASKSIFRNVSLERDAARNEVSRKKKDLEVVQKSLQEVQQPVVDLQGRCTRAKKNMEDDAAAVRQFMNSISPSPSTGLGKVFDWVKHLVLPETPMTEAQVKTLDRLQRNAVQSSTEAISMCENLAKLEQELDVYSWQFAAEESGKQLELARQCEQRLKEELYENLQTSGVATIVLMARASEIAPDIRFADLGKQVEIEWGVDLGCSVVSLADLDTDGEVTKAIPKELRKRDHLLEYNGAYGLVQQSLWSAVMRLKGSPAPLSSFELLRASCGEPIYQGKYVLRLIPGCQEFRNRVLGIIHRAAISIPRGLVKVLRPYQDTGIRWMAQLAENGLGSLLADDMGLGKTLQTVGLFAYLKAHNGLVFDGQPAPVLVILPASLISNWRRELTHWAPDLRVRSFHGSQRSLVGHSASDVVLTTYETCRRNQEQLQRKAWSGVVLDEAQRIKNGSSKTAQAVKSLGRMASFRVALTGTPIENKLEELYSIMDFVNPGYLGGVDAFKQDFVIPLQQQGDRSNKAKAIAQSELLKSIINPFLLRRKKSDKDLLPELPDRVDYDIEVELTDAQRQLYEGVTQDFKEKMAKLKDDPRKTFKRGGLIFGVMNQLRLICGHPATLSDCPEQLKQLLRSRSSGASGKTARLMEIMSEVLTDGGKAIVFVMRKSLMYLLKDLIQAEHKVTVLTYSGDTPVAERPAIEERFRSEPACRVMILTVDAGGVGLNLCAASHVIHFDRCYNPAKENQATDRAHRMGQKKMVCVHKLTSKGTFEERLDQIVKRKTALGDVLDGLDVNFVSSYSDAEIIELFSLRTDTQSSMQAEAAKKGQKRKHSGWEVETPLDDKENVDSTNLGEASASSKEQLKEEDDRQCVVCLDARLELLFIPCGHSCCCADCGRNLIKCPMCREDIGSKTSLNSGIARS